MPPRPTASDALREGRRLGAAGEFAKAAIHVDRALKDWPDDAELQLLRAAVAERLGDWDHVVRHVERFEAIRAEGISEQEHSRNLPEHAHEIMAGWALLQLDRFAEAEARLERAVHALPENPTAWINLGLARKALGKLDGAVAAQQHAASLAPSSPTPRMNLAALRQELGEPAAAIEEIRPLRLSAPDSVEANMFEALLSLYVSEKTPTEIASLHRRAGSLIAANAPAPGARISVPKSADRRLRIGFVSADFADHSVASFLLPLIESLDRDRVQPICYHARPGRDAMTERFAKSAPLQEIVRLSASALVERVRGERIDIAIDCTGYTQGNRLAAFAARLAPIQITWLGYPATTGVSAIDARFVDSITDPAGSEALCTERLVRLDPCFLCWRSRVDAALPQRRPETNGPVRFGSFNDLSKITPRVIDAWSEILRRVPESILLLKAWSLRHEISQLRVREEFKRRGVDPARVELRAFTSGLTEHMALYGEVDLALDTFPYNGTTTTFEALWMGTSVLTLEGASHHARVGSSILTTLGRRERIAPDVESYVERAVSLAADRAALAHDHATLRDRLAASPLRDEVGFAKRFEAAIRALWKEWCRK